jgi:phosphohistidine phosphatase
MKRLILARHAKSSWSYPHLSDLERPLNKRGKKAAPIMGKALKERGILPEAIFASPSVRTQKTSALLAEQLDFPIEEIRVVDSFYGADPGSIVRFARELDDALSTVMLVGHNPTWTALSYSLTGQHLANLPTAGILVIDFERDRWADLDDNGQRRALLIPRDFNCGGGQ